MGVRFIRPLSFRQGRFRVGRVSPTALNIFNNIFLISTDVLINISTSLERSLRTAHWCLLQANKALGGQGTASAKAAKIMINLFLRRCAACAANESAAGKRLYCCQRCKDGGTLAWNCSKECKVGHYPAHKGVCGAVWLRPRRRCPVLSPPSPSRGDAGRAAAADCRLRASSPPPLLLRFRYRRQWPAIAGGAAAIAGGGAGRSSRH